MTYKFEFPFSEDDYNKLTKIKFVDQYSEEDIEFTQILLVHLINSRIDLRLN